MNRPSGPHEASERYLVWRFFACVVKVVSLLLILALAVVLYLVQYGCPEWLAEELLTAFEPKGVALEVGNIRLHPFKELRLHRVCLYQQQVVGMSAFEAADMTMALDTLALLQREWGSVVRRIHIRDGRFRPEFLRHTGRTPLASKGDLPEFATELVLDNVRLGDTTIQHLQARLSSERTAIRASDLFAVLVANGQTGEIRRAVIAYHVDSPRVEAKGETFLDPQVVSSLLRQFNCSATAEYFDAYAFPGDPPHCEASFCYPFLVDLPFRADIRFAARDAVYNGVQILRADGTVQMELSATHSILRVAPLFIARPEGIASVCLTVDRNRSSVAFEGTSHLHPVALWNMIGMPSHDLWDTFQFEGPVVVEGKGVANYQDPTQTRLELRVVGHDLRWNRLKLEEYGATLHVVGLTNILDSIRGRFYEGLLTGRVEVVQAPQSNGTARLAVQAAVTQANFQRLMKDLEAGSGSDAEYAGRLSASLALNGFLGGANLDTLRGQGRMRIKGGKILMLPVFGGLTRMLTGYVPGLNLVVNQTDFFSDFKIAERRIQTEHAVIEGELIRLEGRGHYGFDNTLDFRVQLRLLRRRSLLSYFTDPVMWILGTILEFRLEGDVSDPSWSPFSSTQDLLEKIGLKSRRSQKKKALPEVPAEY